MSDRITGVIVVILSIAFFASSTQLAAPFFADPLGSKAFPMMIAAAAAIAGIVMIIKPDSEPAWPKLAVFGRLLFALLTLVLRSYFKATWIFTANCVSSWCNFISD